MGKLLKTLSWLITGIIITVIAVVIGIITFFDPNDYKSTITEQVKTHTGRDLVINGDLSFSFNPWLGVETGALQLSNAQGFGDQPMAAVEAATIRVKLLPLLREKIEMDTISLRGLQLDLQRNANGVSNWADLVKDKKKEKKKGDSDDVQKLLGALAIGGIELDNATVSWNDKQAKQQLSIKQLNLNTGSFRPGEAVDIDMAFNLDAASPNASGDIKFVGTVLANPFAGQASINGMQLNFDLAGKDVPVGKLAGALNTDIEADLIKQRVVLQGLDARLSSDGEQTFNTAMTSNVTLNLKNMQLALKQLKGTLATKQQDMAIEVAMSSNATVNINQQIIQFNKLDADINASGKGIPNDKLVAKVAGDIKANLKKQNVNASNLTINTMGLAISGKLLGTEILSDKRRIFAPIKIAEFNPRKLMQQLSLTVPETADTKALSKASVSTTLALTSNTLAANRTALKLDDSNITGRVALADIKNNISQFDLQIDSINVDRYLPPAAQRPAENVSLQLSPVTAAHAAKAEALLPLDTLRNLTTRGTLRIGNMIASNIKSEKIRVTVNANNGLLKLTPLTANLYRGTYKGNVTIDARKQHGASPVITIDEILKGINVGPLLKDLNGEERVTGVANFRATLTTRGNDMDTLKRNLAGKNGLRIQIKNGVFRGTNVLDQVLQLIALTTSTPVPKSSNQNETRFDIMGANFDVANGKAKTNKLIMRSREFVLKEKGSINLIKETVKFNGDLQVAKSYDFPNASKSEKERIRSLKIPVGVSCKYTDFGPGCVTYSVGKVVEAYLKQAFKRKAKGELLKKIAPKSDSSKPASPEDQLKRKLLEGILGR